MSKTSETLPGRPRKESRGKRFFTLKRRYLAFPYALFLLLFVVIPLLLIVGYAFVETDIVAGEKVTTFSFQAAASFFTSPSKWSVLFVSLFVGIQTTIICLLLSYPAAYFLAEKKFNSNKVLVVLFIMPMWINFVIRTGATRDLLDWFGLSGSTHPWEATIIGMDSLFDGINTPIAGTYNKQHPVFSRIGINVKRIGKAGSAVVAEIP